MAFVSVIEASKLAKVSRKTVYQYVESGKLSASKNRLGKTEIDVSELRRVFGGLHSDISPVAIGGRDVTNHAATVTPEKSPVPPSLEVLVENARLHAENSQLRERLEEARDDKEKLFARLSEAQASIKLLTHAPEPEKEKKGFWARLTGR